MGAPPQWRIRCNMATISFTSLHDKKDGGKTMVVETGNTGESLEGILANAVLNLEAHGTWKVWKWQASEGEVSREFHNAESFRRLAKKRVLSIVFTCSQKGVPPVTTF